MNKLDWGDKEIARQIEKVFRHPDADPRRITEALLDKICQLTNQQTEESNKQVRMDRNGLKEDGNDGILGDEDDLMDHFDSPWNHFEGLGISPDIPVYLRTTGKVQNLKYSKKETELYLNEIWIAKEQYEAHLQRERAKTAKANELLEEPTVANGGKIHLRDFYLIFLEVVPFISFFHFSQEKFKTHTRSVEFSYNFFDSLKKYDFDSDCKLFLMIINGELTEEVVVSRTFNFLLSSRSVMINYFY
jgi:hypothetical protein